MRIAILGRPNVGKSSLINALLHDDRAIVSAVPGTTRDNVDVPFAWEGHPYTLIDTAGMRQERRIRDELESRMTGRSAHAVNRANLCVLVLDIIAGAGLQEKKIGGLISKANKPCIIVCNKWDLAKEQGDTNRKARDLFLEVLHRNLFFLTYAPVIFTSAKSGENVDELMKWVGKINENRLRKIPTARLNDILHRAQERQLSPARSNRRFKIYYATQQFDTEHPTSTPTFLVFINDMRLLTASYQRFLEEQLRSEIDLGGCPIRWIWKEKSSEKRKGS
jgi:GTP-binding protein